MKKLLSLMQCLLLLLLGSLPVARAESVAYGSLTQDDSIAGYYLVLKQVVAFTLVGESGQQTLRIGLQDNINVGDVLLASGRGMTSHSDSDGISGFYGGVVSRPQGGALFGGEERFIYEGVLERLTDEEAKRILAGEPRYVPVITPPPIPRPTKLEVRCTPCNGTGKMKCSSCSGSGEIRWYYSGTYGSSGYWGTKTCFSCSGKGYYPHAACGGDGYY